MIRYHGSNVQIERIELEKSKPFKDFGRGFYLSPDRQQAEKMAIFRSKVLGNAPTVTEFSFDECKLYDGTLRFLSFDSILKSGQSLFLKTEKSRILFKMIMTLYMVR